MDTRWRSEGAHRKAPRRQPAWSRERQSPGAGSRTYSGSCCQLHDVARGLRYLHSRNVVHGDLKGVRANTETIFTIALMPFQPNILVGKDGRARITDFGLATITQNADSIRSASDGHGHTARWTAPEILNEEGTYSKEADIFSFAMVTIEVHVVRGGSIGLRSPCRVDIYWGRSLSC